MPWLQTTRHESARIAYVVAVVGMFTIMIFLAASAAFPSKSFSVSATTAYWTLGVSGYILHVELKVNAPTQLLGVEVDGSYFPVVYDVEPPSSSLDIPLPKHGRSVALHFQAGYPVRVVPSDMLPETDLSVAWGNRYVFLVGSLRKGGIVTAFPTAGSTLTVVATAPGEEYRAVSYIMNRAPFYKGPVIGVDKLGREGLFNYTTIIFYDVAPEPDLLKELVKKGIRVVIYSWDRNIGEKRFDFLENGSLVVKEYPRDSSDVDYFGAHCTMHSGGYVSEMPSGVLDKISKVYGRPEASYSVISSSFCSRRFDAVFAYSDKGGIAFGVTRGGYYYASISFKHVLVLAEIGFFSSETPKYYLGEIGPFKGVKPIPADLGSGSVVVSVISGGTIYSFKASRAPIAHSYSGGYVTLDIGVSSAEAPSWRGNSSVKVVEVSYNGNPLGVVINRKIILPASTVFRARPLSAYLVYVNGSLVHVIADEGSVFGRPSVYVKYNGLYETFFLEVGITGKAEGTYIVKVNGRTAAVLNESHMVFHLGEKRLGSIMVSVEDPYGRIAYSKIINVRHFYEDPLFVAAVLSLAVSAATAYYYVKRRSIKEVESVKLVVHLVPESEIKGVSPSSVEEAVLNLTAVRKLSPTLGEVADYLYRRHPIVKTYTDTFAAMSELLSTGKGYRVYGRYMPELDDMLSVVAPPGRDPRRDFYSRVVKVMAVKYGGEFFLGEELKDIVDLDGIVIVGDKLLALVYATADGEARDAINRAFLSLNTLRKIRLPYTFVGVAVVTESRLVGPINELIDRILGHDRAAAERILRDMTVFTQLSSAPKSAWFKHFIVAAVPMTLLAPLISCAKLGHTEFANKFYRLYGKTLPMMQQIHHG